MDATAEAERWQRIGRVIRAATGEEWGDGLIVTDVLKGYAEPGYGLDDAVVVLGNWNDKRWPREGEPPLTREERLPSRLAGALEWLGCELEWLDEWYRCEDCYRAFRCQPDSYSWKMYGAIVNECEPVCADCLRENAADYLIDKQWANNPRNAVTWMDAAGMLEVDWEQWEPDNPRQYESGWHPGQDDDPVAILETIRETTGRDVVFLIDGVGQFDMRFSAWLAPKEEEED